MLIVFIFLGVAVVQLRGAEECLTPNEEPAECIPIEQCPILLNALKDPSSDAFVHMSYCGARLDDNLVCCGTSSNFIEPQNTFTDEKVCGIQHSDDYLHGYDPVLSQFPWVAMIGYQRKNGGTLPFDKRYKCGGSLISKRYILTSAECLTLSRVMPVTVRLGEFNVVSEIDCQEESRVYECADEVQDFRIDTIVLHPGYNKKTKVNNIGLIKLNKVVMYTDYIRPICLPSVDKVKAKPGNTLAVAGWGANYTNTESKKVTYTTLASNKVCQNALADASTEFSSNTMCGLPVDSTGQCEYVNRGDAVMFSHKYRWHQEGILSYVKSCEHSNPWIFTKVESYIDWIKETLES